MSNIHRLSDVEAFPRRSGYLQQSSSFGPSEVRCIDSFFPGFGMKSFILWISVVQVLVYVASLVYGSYELRPSGRTLHAFGDCYGPDIQSGEIWRIVTPIFLHASIWHILFNILFQMRMGFPLEQTYGIPRFALLYFASGIAGNLFSTAIGFCSPAVGASTAGFGLIGIQMCELALAWHTIRDRDVVIFNIVAFAVLAAVMAFAPHSNIDWRGHLGGFIAGLAIGMLYNKTLDNPPWWYKTGSVVSIGCLVVLYVGCTIIIFAIPASVRGC